jgi:membrane fusion protein (multidrug efflux system)
VLLGIVAIGVLVGGFYATRWWMHHRAFVSTDDAQVAGDLVNISARIPGHVAEVLVDEGQAVKAGDVLARLDDADFKAQVAQAQAALAVAESNLASSQTGVSFQESQTNAQIAQADAHVATARAGVMRARADAAKAADDLVRVQQLFKVGGISRQQLEASRAGASTAAAGVASAQGQLRAAEEARNLAMAGTQQVEIKKGGVSTVEAQIQQARAALESAKLQLAHSVITAPANGMVARRTTNVGEQVAPGQGLFSLAKTDTVWVLAYVEETEIRRVAPNASVHVHIDAFPREEFKGNVALVNAVTGSQFSLMPTNNASGNFTKVVQRIPVKITVADPDHRLKPGMSAVIDIDARP